jgi:hypothetical protein
MTKKGSLDFLFLIYYIESRRRLQANREFQQYSPEEQFLFRYFRMAEAGEEGEWMAPAEILKILHQEVDIPLNAKRVAAFRRILRKQGIPSRHTRKGTVYQLVRA